MKDLILKEHHMIKLYINLDNGLRELSGLIYNDSDFDKTYKVYGDKMKFIVFDDAFNEKLTSAHIFFTSYEVKEWHA